MQMFNPGGVHPQKLEEQGIAYVQQNFPKLSTFKNCRAKVPAGGVPYPGLLQHFTLQAGVANVKLGMEGAYGLGGSAKHANAKARIDKLYSKPDENPYKGFQNSPGMDGYKTLPHLGYYKDN